ncbi:hypothetical protein C9994_10525 [Marivirga lumbricoides]|uniref:TonB-dependent receptor plug domain-containing protein n=1 Tax=Marivirga lumbricoides TaxID=1046115 RepID=A0A2T4DPH3_9BACT|nr:hypothetical protein C9994_10525 [Marivirga lumbricoides]
MRHLSLLIKLWLYAHLGIAQEMDISGIVKDANTGEALPGAHVLVPSSFSKSNITNEKGYFFLKNLREGDTLIVTFIGYQERIFLASESRDSITILLQPGNVKLKEVMVKSAVLGAENFSFSKLTPIDIYQNPNSKADALVAVNTSASSTTTDENAAVSFRGASPNQTGYFLNGVPIKNPIKYAQLTNTGTLSIFNTDFLKKVTVFPGNPPLEYGQSTSGTIVLETADRFPSYWQQTASISLANLGYSARGEIGKQTFVGVFANYQFDEALKAVNPINFENINAFKSLDGGLLLSSHQKWGSLKFYQYGLWDNYNFQYRHPSYQNAFLQEAVRSISTLQWVQELNDWQISAVLGNSYLDKKIRFGNLNFSEKDFDPYGALNFTWRKDNNLLKTGYSFWHQNNFREGRFPTYSYAMSPEHPSSQFSSEQSASSHELYTFYRKILRNHSIGSGVRLGYLPELQKRLYSYQINYRYELSPSLKVKAGVGRYYQIRNTERAIDYAYQSSIDLHYSGPQWAIEQSFYYNFGQEKEQTKGAESRITYQPNSKIQLDQSLSYVSHNTRKDQWFIRSFAIYKPFSQWSLNASYQSFAGGNSALVSSASFNNELSVYAPFQSGKTLSFQPYSNLSLGINHLFAINGYTNGIAFISVTNLLDTKNSFDINYNFDYSQYDKMYLSRRSIYAGIIINLINKK